MSTTLENVGLQLWSGALLLADYLLARPELVREKTVLELGAGLGLPSIVAARFCGATRVTATDYGEEVLSLCEQNLKASLSERFRSESARRAGADESAAQGEAWSVREMNWLDESFPLWEDPTDSPSDTTPLPTNPPASFAWEKTDTTAFIHSTTVILAADVIYTPAATEQLVRRLKTLLQRTLRGEDRALFLAVEKRLGFTLSGEERAPSYDHFWNVMREANEELDKWGLPCLGDGAGGIPMIEGEQGVTKVPRFQWKLEPTEFQSVPQRVSGYTRTKEMEVWKMWLDY
ncbi:hypothetical protein M427DRAFT_59295 [Gonapodya prolifera JEL478]|uniref:S-adenosyl-L-methionine-dependent methyltransferase n=1 Tax=Gonapodya prolifera (strain JEL478) TaxID=1344416 RepID=A0A139A7I6_GONPJ|nr:hypothetical protein M427DRAFT_59295 [Gonapodya prolifera JEL478]|eukprot:KXS12771.1 hypothetical protein M427DRAFT_59295 [Gonapodya prolifera JEL478]